MKTMSPRGAVFTLADITVILSENRVNMRAINTAATTDYGVPRLIVADADRLTAVLEQDGIGTISGENLGLH